ncbi:hypothetical protein VNO77_20336 [Canavalia gladiata]|uniref:Uncharacterized protein n=1 Tax=Canavalia gladiata TaxID=3824 RepID=A0AAN9LP90_CANGL
MQTLLPYVFLLRHGDVDVFDEAVASLIEDLKLLENVNFDKAFVEFPTKTDESDDQFHDRWKEPEIRSHVEITLEMFMQAKLSHPICPYPLAEAI